MTHEDAEEIEQERREVAAWHRGYERGTGLMRALMTRWTKATKEELYEQADAALYAVEQILPADSPVRQAIENSIRLVKAEAEKKDPLVQMVRVLEKTAQEKIGDPQ